MQSSGRSWGGTPPVEPQTGLVRRAAAVAGLVAVFGIASMAAAGTASAASTTTGSQTSDSSSAPAQHEPNGRSWS